ncbi:MAG: ATP-binding protein [Polyangiaceae bacterium]
MTVRLPADWIDRLLVAVCEVEPGQTAEAALGTVLDAAAHALPQLSFGVRVPDARPRRAVRVVVVRRSASLIAIEPPLEGPLFPELSCESQYPIDLEPEGVVAVAVNDPAELPEPALLDGLASRLSMSIGAALRIARQVARSATSIPPSDENRRTAVQHDKLAGLGRVVAGVVHELNNPVTSILAYAEYLRRKAEREPLGKEDVDRLARIEEAAQRIHGFSRELIAYARPSTEVPVELHVHEVIDRALMFCEHVLSRAQIQVERSFGDVKPVRGLGGQLAQVFVNLFTNAAKAMSETGGTLRIETKLDELGTGVHISVLDTGCGIAEQSLPKIFEPFFTASQDGGGTGLGLSIVREIVVAHRGRVWAERRDGTGAAFHVLLPAAED